MDRNRWLITSNILAPTRDILFMTTSLNCSYGLFNLFNVSDDNFVMFDNDLFIEIFNAECMVTPSL